MTNGKIVKIIKIGDSHGIILRKKVLKNFGIDPSKDMVEYTIKKIYKNKQ